MLRYLVAVDVQYPPGGVNVDRQAVSPEIFGHPLAGLDYSKLKAGEFSRR
jgi:hypothetical protein